MKFCRLFHIFSLCRPKAAPFCRKIGEYFMIDRPAAAVTATGRFQLSYCLAITPRPGAVADRRLSA